jgi:hypothetical protein
MSVIMLANLEPGQSARVEAIVFDALRGLCGDIGIREGESVHCRAGTAGVLLLDTQDGRVVSLVRDWARFIRVLPTAPA